LSTSSDVANSDLRSICVFCGSSAGRSAAFRSASLALGDALVSSNCSLVYGGAHIGLMGAVADRVLSSGGRVVGVIPQSLVDVEVAHSGLTELHITDGMHERKAKMADAADAFIALPGGIGTLEELFEILTWAQLGYHTKPIGLLNVDGYYDSLLSFLDNMVSQGFAKASHVALLQIAADPADLMQRLKSAAPLPESKIYRSAID